METHHLTVRGFFTTFMRDRLTDLQGSQTEQPIEPQKKSWAKKKAKVEPMADSGIKSFFEKLESIKEEITSARFAILSLNESQQRGLNNTITETQKNDNEKEIESLMDKIQAMVKKIQTDLKDLDVETKQLQTTNANHPELPIRVAQHAVLLKLFVDVMQDYKQAQEQHQSKLKERMMKQALVVNPNATPKEVEKMIEEPVFGMVTTSHRREALSALDDINRKHHEVSRITDTILQLQQLFLDVSVLVQAQGSMLDTIGTSVEKAAHDTEKGVEHMQGAIKQQKKTRKRMRCLLVILVIIVILAIVIPLTVIR